MRVSGEIEVNCAILDEEKDSNREGRENKSPPPFFCNSVFSMSAVWQKWRQQN